MITFERPGGVAYSTNGPVEIAYSGVEDGNVDPGFGDSAEAMMNAARLRHAVGTGRVALLAARHGTNIVDIPDGFLLGPGSIFCADGVFTDSPGVVMELHPADCDTMVFYGANEERVAGLVHAGWRGAHEDIHLKAVQHMVDTYGMSLADIRIFFAPSIGSDSYSFKAPQPEQTSDTRWANHLEWRGEQCHVDVRGRIVADLKTAGIDHSQLVMSSVDTGADERFFSHYRSKRGGGPDGRNGIVVKLREERARRLAA